MRIAPNHHDFSIISNNCWGGLVYQDLGLMYRTPFVGLYLYAPDYLRLLGNLSHFLKTRLVFIEPAQSAYAEELRKNGTFGTYPVGLLSDVEVHFVHYRSKEEARRKWEIRARRVNFHKLIVKFCDRDLCSYDLLRQFEALDFPNKICFTARVYKEFPSCICLTECAGEECVSQEHIHSKNHLDVVRYIQHMV